MPTLLPGPCWGMMGVAQGEAAQGEATPLHLLNLHPTSVIPLAPHQPRPAPVPEPTLTATPLGLAAPGVA